MLPRQWLYDPNCVPLVDASRCLSHRPNYCVRAGHQCHLDAISRSLFNLNRGCFSSRFENHGQVRTSPKFIQRTYACAFRPRDSYTVQPGHLARFCGGQRLRGWIGDPLGTFLESRRAPHSAHRNRQRDKTAQHDTFHANLLASHPIKRVRSVDVVNPRLVVALRGREESARTVDPIRCLVRHNCDRAPTGVFRVVVA